MDRPHVLLAACVANQLPPRDHVRRPSCCSPLPLSRGWLRLFFRTVTSAALLLGFQTPTTHERLSSNVSTAEPRLDVGGLTCSIQAVTCPGQYRRRLQYASTHSAVQGSICIYYHRLPLDIFLFYCNKSEHPHHCALLQSIQGHPPLYCSRVFFKSCCRFAPTQQLQHD